MEGLDAVGAHLNALAIHAGPLEVRIFTALARRIVVTAQKDTAGDHAGPLLTQWAFDGHSLDIVYENCYFGKTRVVSRPQGLLAPACRSI